MHLIKEDGTITLCVHKHAYVTPADDESSLSVNIVPAESFSLSLNDYSFCAFIQFRQLQFSIRRPLQFPNLGICFHVFVGFNLCKSVRHRQKTVDGCRTCAGMRAAVVVGASFLLSDYHCSA